MKIMSIGGNCAGINFLGEFRVRGPVDNWFAHNGIIDTISLVDGFENQIKEGWISTNKRVPGHKGDSPFEYKYKSYCSVHMIMSDPASVRKVLERHQAFLKFYENSKTDPNCFFLYTLNQHDINIADEKHMFLNDTFKKNLNEVLKVFPKEKLIFVGTPKLTIKGGFYAHAIDIPKDLNYVDITDVKFSFGEDDVGMQRVRRDFKEYVLNMNTVPQKIYGK